VTPPAPLVGIPSYHLPHGRVSGWVTGGFALPERYVSALRRAGVRPVILPGHDPSPPEEVLTPLTGLVLAGGGDIEPSRYGAEPHPSVYGVDAERDTTEAELTTAALALGVPTLAICRGFQVLNVLCGGTLEQHLPERLGTTHGDPATGRSASHSVRVAPGSRLAAAVGAAGLERCTSHHHQGIATIGDGLVAAGWSPDGLVEALEPEDPHPWFVAVQWHPEATAADDPGQQALFDAFAAQVRARAAAG
jgi:putative glutamine amidotransferase